MRESCQHLGGVKRLVEGLPVHRCRMFGECSADGRDSTAVCDENCEHDSRFERSSACRNRGEVIRRDASNLCGARGEQTDVFSCDIHGECAVRRYCQVQSVRICLHCTDFDEGPEPVPAKFECTPKRHLIYHIWPKKDNGVWQWNVSELLKRIDLFDGVRAIGVVTSDDADSVESVKAAFAGHRIDHWIVQENHPRAGEGMTFVKMLDCLPRESGVTFYGHAKGVKHGPHRQVRRWTSIMYRACLDGRGACLPWLERFPIVGSLRTYGWYAIPGGHGWHYAGTYFWFRNRDVFENPKCRSIDENLYGCVEVWPGNLFPARNAACIVGERPSGSPYEGDGFDEVEKFLDSQCTPISVIIPTLGRASILGVIKNLLKQLGADDEVLIVADGDQAKLKVESRLRSWLAGDPRLCLVEYHDAGSAVGNAQRTFGQGIAKGDWIWFVDDDDAPAADALEKIRNAVRRAARPTIFRIDYPGGPIWRLPELKVGNVSSQSLVVPNDPAIPRFPATDKYTADFDWIQSVSDSVGVHWCESVIYKLERHSRGATAG